MGKHQVVSRPAPGILWRLQERWHNVDDTWSHVSVSCCIPHRVLQHRTHFSGQLVTLHVCLELGGLGCAHKQLSAFTRHSPLELRAQDKEGYDLMEQSPRQPCWEAASPSWGDNSSQVEKGQDSQAMGLRPVVRRGRDIPETTGIVGSSSGLRRVSSVAACVEGQILRAHFLGLLLLSECY